MRKHVSLDGTTPRGRLAVGGVPGVPDVDDKGKLADSLKSMQQRTRQLEESSPPDHVEFEVDVLPGERIELAHGFNSPTRFWCTHWKVEDDSGTFDSQTEAEELGDALEESAAETADAVLEEVNRSMDSVLLLLPNLGQDPGVASGCFCPNNNEASVRNTAPYGTYDVVVRITGEVEGKGYTGGSNDGAYFQTGGTPNATNANFYKIYVSSPEATYYINRAAEVVGTNYALDYQKTLRVDAGATVSLQSNAVDGKMNKGTGLTVSGITNPTLPYYGQWMRIDCVSVTKI